MKLLSIYCFKVIPLSEVDNSSFVSAVQVEKNIQDMFMKINRNIKHHQKTCRPQIIFPEKGSTHSTPAVYGPVLMLNC